MFLCNYLSHIHFTISYLILTCYLILSPSPLLFFLFFLSSFSSSSSCLHYSLSPVSSSSLSLPSSIILSRLSPTRPLPLSSPPPLPPLTPLPTLVPSAKWPHQTAHHQATQGQANFCACLSHTTGHWRAEGAWWKRRRKGHNGRGGGGGIMEGEEEGEWWKGRRNGNDGRGRRRGIMEGEEEGTWWGIAVYVCDGYAW